MTQPLDQIPHDALYRTLFEEANDAIFLHRTGPEDPRGGVIAVNEVACRRLGFAREELLRMSLADIEAREPPLPPPAMRARLESEGSGAREAVHITRDGRRISVEVSFRRIELAGGAIVLSIARDITERKRLEAARERMVRLLRLLNTPSGLHELGRDAVRFFQEWSGCEAVGIRLRDGDRLPYLEASGFAPQVVQAAGRLSLTGAGGGEGPLPECLCADVFLGRFPPDSPYLTEGGSFWTGAAGGPPAWAAEGASPVRLGDCCRGARHESAALIPLKSGSSMLGLLQLSDGRNGRFTRESISLFERAGASLAIALDQRMAHDALRRSEEKCRLISENTGDVIWIMDLAAGCYTYMSPSVERLAGYSPDELLSCDWRRPLTPESGERLMALMPARVAAFERGDQSVRVAVDELESVRKDGTVVPTEAVTALVADESGRACQLIGVTRDISERKQAERERAALQLRLSNSQKMESMGRLAGGVAHDFNNLLTVINGYTSMALSSMHGNDPVRPAIEEIRKAGERAAALVRQLLVFSRKQVLEPEALSLNAVVGGMESLLMRLVGADAHIATRLAPVLPVVFADRRQVEQVVMNLVVNARDAMPHGGRITIETSLRVLGEVCPMCGGAAQPGSYVELAVHDSGTGMDEQVLRQLFEPFFTTKEAGKGTGLGLATVEGIVAQSRGHIDVQSAPGEGTCFRVCFPVAEGTQDAQTPRPARILVVDGEAGVRRFLREVLEKAGHEVLEAADGEQVLVALRASPVELVIADLATPEPEGIETIRALRREFPSVGVIVMSSAAGESYSRCAGAFGAHAALPKPVAPEVLLAEVATLLQART